MRQRPYPTVDHQRLGRFLKATRLKTGLTQRDVADHIRQPVSFVSKVESGTRQLQVLELLEICSVLGISPGAFLDQFQDEFRG